MALFFNASTERVTYTAPLMGDPSTLIAWCKPNTVTAAFRQLAGQLSESSTQWRWASSDNAGSGVMRMALPGTSAQLSYRSNTGFVVVDVWNYLVWVIDTAQADDEKAQLYRGDLNTAATEVTYALTDEPSALRATNDDLLIGGDGDGDGFGFEGEIAMVSVWPGTALTLEQVVAHQWATVPKVAGCEVFSHYNAGDATDRSGQGNNGTITGATQADHVPLPPQFGMDTGQAFAAAAAPTGRIMSSLAEGGGLAGAGGIAGKGGGLAA